MPTGLQIPYSDAYARVTDGTVVSVGLEPGAWIGLDATVAGLEWMRARSQSLSATRILSGEWHSFFRFSSRDFISPGVMLSGHFCFCHVLRANDDK